MGVKGAEMGKDDLLKYTQLLSKLGLIILMGAIFESRQPDVAQATQ